MGCYYMKVKKCAAATAIILLFLQGMIYMNGCQIKEKFSFDYDTLYHEERTTAYEEIPRATSRARYGYTHATEQGYNGWYYMYGASENFAEMQFDREESVWKGGGATLKDEYMYPSEVAAVRMYHVSRQGDAVIYGNIKSSSASSVAAEFSVYVGIEKVYEGWLEAGDTEGKYFECKHELEVGDKVFFVVEGKGAEVLFDPTVTFENAQDFSLYHLSEQGKYYGDVFPYYCDENRRLYMFYLWSDNALTDPYIHALEISNNMLTFTDVPEANNYETWEFVKRNTRLNYYYDIRRFVDQTKYKYGARDFQMYFDEENNRYILIVGAYYEYNTTTQTSDLVIYVSDDEYALNWTRPGNVVEAGFSGNLPECPDIMKIGDRWYSFVSVSHKSVHQVGALQYWTGDPGVDCMDVNWLTKDYAYLDGEDLCAARPVRVGNLVYMWGWIPNVYDSVPLAPWAGYLNLPREIIQREDGSLGGRLDPGLSKLLNYGNIYTLSEKNFAVEGGSAIMQNGVLNMTGTENYVRMVDCDRTYTTFRMELGSANEAGYVMRQGDREYRVVVQKKGEKRYMTVHSPDDTSHKINSTIELPKGEDVFDIKNCE